MEEDDIYIWVLANQHAKVQSTILSKVKGEKWRGRCGRGLVDAAVHSKSLEMLRLVCRYEDVNQQDGHGWTALHSACDLCLLPAATFLIIRPDGGSPAMVNRTNKDNVSALHLACQRGCDDIVRLLLHFGAWREIKDMKGQTPRDYAIMNGRFSAAELLRNYDATSSNNAHAQNNELPGYCCQLPATSTAVQITDYVKEHNKYLERTQAMADIARENQANTTKVAYTKAIKTNVDLTNTNRQLEQNIRTLTDKCNQLTSERDEYKTRCDAYELEAAQQRQKELLLKNSPQLQVQIENAGQQLQLADGNSSSSKTAKPRCISNDLEKLLVDVANAISPHVHMKVGIKLGLSRIDVERIEADNPRNCWRCTFEILHTFASRKLREVDYSERSVIWDLHEVLSNLQLGEAVATVESWMS